MTAQPQAGLIFLEIKIGMDMPGFHLHSNKVRISKTIEIL